MNLTAIDSWSMFPQRSDGGRLRMSSDAATVGTAGGIREIDGDTLGRAVRGDTGAFEDVVRHYQPLIARRMSRFSRNGSEIEELTHDVFVQAFVSIGGYKAKAPFSHWLQRVATRVGLRHWESRGRQHASLDEALDHVDVKRDHAAAAADRAALAARLLDAAMGQLSADDRVALMLVHLEGRTVKEAADLMGRTVTMTKVRLFRARLRLKAVIDGSARYRSLLAEVLE